MILGIPGIYQILIGFIWLSLLFVYIYALVKIWKSNLNSLNKILYTIILICFPLIGLILVYILMNRYYIAIEKK